MHIVAVAAAVVAEQVVAVEVFSMLADPVVAVLIPDSLSRERPNERDQRRLPSILTVQFLVIDSHTFMSFPPQLHIEDTVHSCFIGIVFVIRHDIFDPRQP